LLVEVSRILEFHQQVPVGENEVWQREKVIIKRREDTNK
jgi:hypothetical protein